MKTEIEANSLPVYKTPTVLTEVNKAYFAECFKSTIRAHREKHERLQALNRFWHGADYEESPNATTYRYDSRKPFVEDKDDDDSE